MDGGETGASGAGGSCALVKRHAHRAGFVLAVVVLLGAVLALPLVVRSLAAELFERDADRLYDLITGEPVVTDPPEGAGRSVFAVSVVGVDPVAMTATLAVSAGRECPATCETIAVTLLALDDATSRQRGTPPATTLTLQPTDLAFSETVDLPLRGKPTLYPFDVYRLLLGVGATVTPADGTPQPVSRERFTALAEATIQNAATGPLMAPPRPVAPDAVRRPPGTPPLLAVQELTFRQPAYVSVLAMLLVLLISVTGIITLVTRPFEDLAFGVGGLVLGTWGVRSVLVNQPLPGLSLVDVMLSGLILLLLFGFLARAAIWFWRKEQALRAARQPIGPA